jgi:hypothetical protein
VSTVEQEPKTTESMPYSLRPMLPDDSLAVAEIEREAFPTTWPPTPFRKELNNRLGTWCVTCPLKKLLRMSVPQHLT